MEGWPYSAYNRLPHAAQPEFQQYTNAAAANSASAQQILLQHQLRQAHAQQYLPPSLVAAASNNKATCQTSMTSTASTSSWKTGNSNGLVIIPEPHKATNSRSYAEETGLASNSRTMRHAAELKTSQPVFPGQPPPLARVETTKHYSSPQPPPRQSSQPPQRNANINRTAFPGQQPPASVSSNSPAAAASNFREPGFQQQQNRPDLIVQRQQPSPQMVQQQSPQQIYNNPSPQSVASPQGYYQNPSPQNNYYQQQQFQQQQQQQQQHQKARNTPTPTSSATSSRSRSRSKSSKSMIQPQQQQQVVQQMQHQQYQHQQQQQDVGLARLGALGALHDLPDGNDLLNESTINYEDLNLGTFGNSGRNQVLKQTNEQRWLTRTTELLDLSSGDSRDTPGTSHEDSVFNSQQNLQGQGQQLIPQIVINPYGSGEPMMSFAVQAYQHQWLLQQQAGLTNDTEEAAITHEMEEEAFKPKVVCIPPDEEMGFLLNLPPPCNVISQPSTIGLSGKVPESPYMQAYHKFLRGETPVKPPAPTEEPPPDQLPGKKKYIPPYTPNRTKPFSPSTVSSRGSASRGRNVSKPVSRPIPQQPQITTPSASSSSSLLNQQQQQLLNKQKLKGTKHQALSEDEALEVEMAVLPKRESSRRKAKDNSSKKIHMQERLLEDDEELPGLDLSDSDDDATWTPFKADKNMTGDSAVSRHKRLASDDEDELEYRSVVSTPKKPKKSSFHTTNIVPPDQDYRPGDFVVLRDESAQDQAPIWRFDSKTLLQRFNVAGKDEAGDTLYKSANLFSGYIASNRQRYVSVAVKFMSSEGTSTIVKLLKSGSSSDQSPSMNPEIRKRSYAETSQFQENFEVYIQALISQCLDSNFLDEVFSDQDEYFVSNIEKVDSVTLLRKDKVMNGVSWSIRFQQALSTWPCLNDLGPSATHETNCGACDREKSTSMVQMFGQPYHQNTLKSVPPSEQACMNRNFSVCSKCGRLAQLFHKLHHQKQKLFSVCSEVVESRKKNSPGLDTTRMLNELLADDTWLETQFRKMQDLWADADTFVR